MKKTERTLETVLKEHKNYLIFKCKKSRRKLANQVRGSILIDKNGRQKFLIEHAILNMPKSVRLDFSFNLDSVSLVDLISCGSKVLIVKEGSAQNELCKIEV